MKYFGRYLLFLILAALAICPQEAIAQETVDISFGRDACLLGSAAGLFGLSLILQRDMITPDPSTLNPQQVNIFDRYAIYKCSKTAVVVSDMTLLTAFAGGAIIAFTLNGGQQKFNDMLVWGESVLLTAGLTWVIKNGVRRVRPSAYRKSERGEALEKKSMRSFFSGHTSIAFASAVSAASLWSLRHGGERAEKWIWGSLVGTASICGICRVLAGGHFPTDVIAGALAGSLIAWLTVRLHDTTSQNSGERTLLKLSFQF
ncbi:phosphatase PAP2 family protein [bacterium]|nr:phosphatase PAP2 family protein [bacterium]